ncbi:MAG: helix-turn-helix transcriptional regulator, partial [Sphingomonadales bacterium]|nr:helix-turn-helix transcriptional regulator [Sphingomonadales bacterium]
RRVTITFRPAPGDKWATEVEIVAADGTVQRGESIAAADGVPVPVSGTLGFLDTVSLRQPAANTLVMTLGKNGAPVSTRVYTVAKDGASMTETIIWPGNSLPGLETTTFRRLS